MDNRFYSDSEACLSYISNKKVGIIGFGNQGEAHAKNLRDSGIDVAVNLRKSSDKIKLVTSLGFTLLSIESIVKWADIISIQIPDKLIPSVFNNISKMISSEKVILLSHGYVISYKKIKLTRYTNIVLVAPSSSGYALRKAYKKGRGVPGLISYIGEDNSLINDVINQQDSKYFKSIIGEGVAASHQDLNNDGIPEYWVGNLETLNKQKGYWVILDLDNCITDGENPECSLDNFGNAILEFIWE